MQHIVKLKHAVIELIKSVAENREPDFLHIILIYVHYHNYNIFINKI